MRAELFAAVGLFLPLAACVTTAAPADSGIDRGVELAADAARPDLDAGLDVAGPDTMARTDVAVLPDAADIGVVCAQPPALAAVDLGIRLPPRIIHSPTTIEATVLTVGPVGLDFTTDGVDRWHYGWMGPTLPFSAGEHVTVLPGETPGWQGVWGARGAVWAYTLEDYLPANLDPEDVFEFSSPRMPTVLAEQGCGYPRPDTHRCCTPGPTREYTMRLDLPGSNTRISVGETATYGAWQLTNVRAAVEALCLCSMGGGLEGDMLFQIALLGPPPADAGNGSDAAADAGADVVAGDAAAMDAP